MSFSKQVKDELNAIQIKSNCCKRAYLYGALLSATVQKNQITLKLSDNTTAEKIISLLQKLYRVELQAETIKRGCCESIIVSFESKKLSDYLSFSDTFDESKDINSIFSCNECKSAFLRGLFCSSGSVSNPYKTYALEIRTPNYNRAKLICSVIEARKISCPSRTNRDNTVGLFYRNESSIEDYITACGGNNALFAFYDANIEKSVRNTENRATNCVARNISKIVAASELYVAAIESLISTNAINDLPDELKITANLRISHPDISLSELAEMHVPPISKSGVSHRLTKIADEARKRKLI